MSAVYVERGNVGVVTLILVLSIFTSMFSAPPVWAQQASGIAGLVRDASGAVLPGVTVEASSPALIEKVRTAVSDGEGRYSITNLRPGTYVVTFSLPGFKIVRREGIQLTAAFTGTVNAEMEVGGLEETITVTGAAPLVDAQSVSQGKVISTELLATLPVGSKTLQTLAAFVPGLVGFGTNVGGSSGIYSSNSTSSMLFHGKSGAYMLYDGMSSGAAYGQGTVAYVMNPATAEETVVETGGLSAESNAIIVLNLVPKVGGNRFTFGADTTYTNPHLQSDNLTDALRARGATTAAKVLRFYDANVTLGGPIRQDRLWFFTAGRMLDTKNQSPGIYFNKTQGTPFYTPDLDRPAFRREWLKAVSGRLTWQASEKNKVSGFADVQSFFNRGRGGFQSPEADTSLLNLSPVGLFQGTWTSPRTNRFLLEAGASYLMGRWPYPSPGDGVYRVKPTDISITELSTGFVYNAKARNSGYPSVDDEFRYVERFAASYVTGSHAFKAGVQLEQGIENSDRPKQNQDLTYGFFQGVPNRLTQYRRALRKARILDLGLFVQDRWTLKRLTFNYGLRFDYLKGWVPAQPVPDSRFVPGHNFAPVHNIPSWKDLNPRLGASYDLFGTGRTAVKVSLARFVESMGVALTVANNPILTSVQEVNRTWNDTNGNYVPDCDLTNFGANGECGQIADLNFGKNNPVGTRFADDVLRGFAARNASWDFGTEVQHELVPGVSVTAGYYRSWTSNYRMVDNLAVTPADYSPYCITAPVDARLPGGGGYPVCGMYDLAPAKFGQVENLITQASNYYGKGSKVTCGDPENKGSAASRGTTSSTGCGTSDFFGVNVTTRLGAGIQLGGGVDTGRRVFDSCFVIDSPQQLLNCHAISPFKANTSVKMFGSYPLPGAFVVSGTLQSMSGKPIAADYAVPNAAIAPSLGRNLAACGTRAVCTSTALVPLIKPYTQFLDRFTQLDLRLSKVLELGPAARLRANLDIYNVLNASTVLGITDRYGPTWLKPVQEQGGNNAFLPGRLFQLGGQLSF